MILPKWSKSATFVTLTTVLGLALCLRPAWHLARRTVLQFRAQNLWQMAKSKGKPLRQDQPVAWLRSPKGLSTLVLLGASQENLHKFPAWAKDGALPGEDGLGMVFGHRDAQFRKLGTLAVGDPLVLETKTGNICYRVSKIQIVARERLHQSLMNGRSRVNGLVLITCYPFRFAGPAPQRYLVWLEAIEKTRHPEASLVAKNEAL